MERKDIENLKIIKSENDIPSEAKYYSINDIGRGWRTISYLSYYDVNCNNLGDFQQTYSNFYKHLQQIIKNEKIDQFTTALYKVVDLGNGYSLLQETIHTEERLKSMCESLKPKHWK